MSGNPTDVIEQLCVICGVDKYGLALAGQMLPEQIDGDDLKGVIDTLFNADNSVFDILDLVRRASRWPMFDITLRAWSKDAEQYPFLGRAKFRWPDKRRAERLVEERFWDPRLEAAGCARYLDTVQIEDYDGNRYQCPDGGEVRIV
jgi:hypothetical protein